MKPKKVLGVLKKHLLKKADAEYAAYYEALKKRGHLPRHMRDAGLSTIGDSTCDEHLRGEEIYREILEFIENLEQVDELA